MIDVLDQFAGPWMPLLLVVLFLAASLLIIWRLEVLSGRGVEGTVLGTLFMPYFSGLGNLLFIWAVVRQNGPAGEVAVNSIVNNISNLSFLLALPALIWGLDLRAGSKRKKELARAKLHRLSLALTLVAMIFFSIVVWLLGRDGEIDSWDGAALVGLFLFWQCFHVFEVLKDNTRRGESWSPLILLDAVLILAGSYATLVSVDGLVAWILSREEGWVSAQYLGILTGLLMVLPNAVLAFYYASRERPDIVYTSQVGDGHICIPLCLGLFAIFRPIPTTPAIGSGLLLIAGVALVHLFCVVFLRRLPRFVGLILLLLFAFAMAVQATTEW